MRRKAMWVTVAGNMARLDTKAQSTHRTWAAAQETAASARARQLPREVVSAQVIALMQEGKSFTAAVQAVAGLPIEAAYVEV